MRLEPASPLQFGRAILPLLEFGRQFGIKIPDPEGLIEIYLDAVKLPHDLLAVAVSRAIETWKWGNRLPMPAELMALVETEMNERQLDRITLTALAGRFYSTAAQSGSFQVSSIKAKNSVLRDMGQVEFERRMAIVRAQREAGEPVAVNLEFGQ